MFHETGLLTNQVVWVAGAVLVLGILLLAREVVRKAVV